MAIEYLKTLQVFPNLSERFVVDIDIHRAQPSVFNAINEIAAICETRCTVLSAKTIDMGVK